MNEKRKLEYFSQIALKEAEARRLAIEEEINSEFTSVCDSSAKEIRNRCAAKLRTESYKAEQIKNKDIVEALNQSKKEITNLRNTLTDDLFKRIEKKLLLFMESEAYSEYLMNRIKDKTEAYRNIKVQLSRKDTERYSSVIKERYGFECEAVDILGGYILQLEEKHAIIDDSFNAKIQQEREYFNMFKTSVVVSEEGL